MKILGKSWKYINEGNAHIVVQILGTDYVLRLIKEDGITTTPKNVYDSVNFVNLIMVPLLENTHYGNEQTIEISASDLTALTKVLLPFRPANRIHKSLISQIAIKATNLSIVSPNCEINYCVEIKPKEGYLSSSLKQYSKCYYCFKQYLKLQMNSIEKTSHYCPLDLFSGDRNRMKNALLNMINNPQNNFKLFKNGSLIFNELSSKEDLEEIIKNMNCFSDSSLFLDFIIAILQSDNNIPYIELTKTHTENTEKCYKHCVESNNLDPTSFLYKLLQLQRLSETVAFDVKDLGNDYMDYVSKLIENLNLNKLDLHRQSDRETFYKTADPIHLALISAVAKDCSIMISFSTNYVENIPYVEVGDLKVFYKLALTDLEPKSPQTLSKRKDTEKKMIAIYEKYRETVHEEKL
ncbi:inositol-pentakisphosphate 2-kinase isoform X1 [Trichoplusia ni]|uniref:Inositol-pentakisphosphate 2-kinase n=1 Tax=Trichoplusia ni TaxID=7111 RepID=A0A7E5WDJ1_TRINI|nr:inositol-pentakisphosphate 2-kinase isoform X1 [Trichoplusia ni]